MEKLTGGKCVVCGGEIVELIDSVENEWDSTMPLVPDPKKTFRDVSRGLCCRKCGIRYAFLPKEKKN